MDMVFLYRWYFSPITKLLILVASWCAFSFRRLYRYLLIQLLVLASCIVFFFYWGSVYRWISLTVSKLNTTMLLTLRAEATLAIVCVFLISRPTLRRRGWGGSISFTLRKPNMFLFVLQNTFCLMIAAYPNKAWRSVFLRMWCALTISHSAILIRFGFSSLAHFLLSFFGYRLLFALLCHSLAVFVLLSCPMY